MTDIFSVGLSLAGLPGVTLPCGYISQPGQAPGRDENRTVRLPVGMTIAGRRMEDLFILGVAAAFEREFEKCPPAVAGEWKGY